MKSFICFTLFVVAASASGIVGPLGLAGAPIGLGGPIGLAGLSPLGLGLPQQQILVNQPLVSRIGLGPQVISSPLGLGLGATKVIGGGLPLGVGLGGIPVGAQLGAPWGLGGQIISPLNGGLIIKK